jgi:hypothetical protein
MTHEEDKKLNFMHLNMLCNKTLLVMINSHTTSYTPLCFAHDLKHLNIDWKIWKKKNKWFEYKRPQCAGIITEHLIIIPEHLELVAKCIYVLVS